MNICRKSPQRLSRTIFYLTSIAAKIRDMIVDDIREAQWSGNKEHVLTLLHVFISSSRTLKLAT